MTNRFIILRSCLLLTAIIVAIVGLSLVKGPVREFPLEAESHAEEALPAKSGLPLSSWITVPDIITPQPVPTPGSVPRLDAEQMYVIDSKEPCFALVSPRGIVSLTTETGPVKIRGKFVGGSGIETKTFTGKVVMVVEAQGTGRAEVIVVKEGSKGVSDVFRQLIDANQGPLPPPVPVPPDPAPPVPVPPIPAPVTGFRVILVYETGTSLTLAQQTAMFSPKVEEYLTRKCVGGKTGWRRWDKDVVLAANAEQVWKDLWAIVKPQIGPLPCVVIVSNEKVIVGPDGKPFLITDEASLLALLAKYAGP